MLLGTTVRPLNIEGQDLSFAGLKEPVRCEVCGQFHLRSGYCQARDPINTSVDSDPVHTASVDSLVDSDEKRKAYKREWMRKRRAGLK